MKVRSVINKMKLIFGCDLNKLWFDVIFFEWEMLAGDIGLNWWTIIEDQRPEWDESRMAYFAAGARGVRTGAPMNEGLHFLSPGAPLWASRMTWLSWANWERFSGGFGSKRRKSKGENIKNFTCIIQSTKCSYFGSLEMEQTIRAELRSLHTNSPHSIGLISKYYWHQFLRLLMFSLFSISQE